ncbi:MAG TPA: YfcE family phosphodiesterase [Gemmatimonadaceae bacterium]|nr:YfcE family phosphodiesterase [Gemmatimonadaceae bacterium]
MRIGLMADSHDHVPAIAEFASTFRDAGVAMVLHAGDYCSPFALGALLAAGLPVAGVFGRNDGDREGLRAEAARGVGGELYESPHSVELNGTRILLVYDIADVSDRSINAHAIVVHGCTHLQEQRLCGKTLIVNPGEACGWLHGVPTAAILDLTTRHVDILTLKGEP